MKKNAKKNPEESIKGNISPKVAGELRERRRKAPSAKELSEKIISGNVTALSRAITLIESTNPTHTETALKILEQCLPYANKSVRIGITGVPGAGKSTFIEAFGNYITSLGKKVAVLAVDPSSSLSKGSILGDKTRMEELVKNNMAFIRPSPAGDSLGGVARKTRESILLCEACGFDVILIETVGVGQSEIAVHGMVDFFLLLKLAGAGDELQGIKRGIMEMADAVIINKADGDNLKKAHEAKTDFMRALHLFPPKESGWQTKVLLVSSTEKRGIKEVWQLVQNHVAHCKENGFFAHNRKAQNKTWLLQAIESQLKQHFYQNPTVKKALEIQLKKIENNKTTPFAAAVHLLSLV